MSPVADGKTFTFWAGGHIVYFMCVLTVNIILLRSTHNWTGYSEGVVAMQLLSFFILVYLDSVLLTTKEIAYFFDEYLSSWTAWLGVLLVGSMLFVEKGLVDAYDHWRRGSRIDANNEYEITPATSPTDF